MTEITYFHMLFDKHEIVLAEGAWSESLHTGPEALRSLPPAAIDEIKTLFPDLLDRATPDALARPTPAEGRRIKRMIMRHRKNGVALFS